MIESRFTSPLHDERTATVLGAALGVAFTICFATGLLSHFAYDQPSWWFLGPRPAGIYRVTQGLHVATGTASIPLLLVKLWVVYPHLTTWPPVRSLAHAVERLSLLPLVGGSLFLLFSGVGNLARWRPWGFFFTDGHYHAAVITIGALVVHVGAKATTIAASARRADGGPQPADGLTRRRLLGAAATGSVALTVATVGQTFRPLAAVSVLGPRDPRVGPQGVPVNVTASAAGVLEQLAAPGFAERYRLEVVGPGDDTVELSLADLRHLPVTEAVLPIACVEGWSAEGRWRGVAVRDLLAALGLDGADRVVVESMQAGGRYRRSELLRAWVRDRHTLLAYDLAGAPLVPDHGAPLRLIAPNRPGVLQTKWLARVVVS